METIITSIIAATSAIVGTIIGATVNYLIEKKEFKEKEREEKRNAYLNFIKSMQDFMNYNSEDEFRNFQEAVNIILLYATSNIANEIYNYYIAIIEQEKNGIITQEKHCEFQNKIINLIRKDINEKSKEIQNVKLISFRPNKIK